MKITKLSKGYRINLSDTEMNLLRNINSEGIQGYFELHESDETGLGAPEKRILTEIQTDKREWF
tara:strand:+ start:460 stop:651 length:192 start_codon:yes stop_codon:yes gene_type:complete